MNQLLESLSNMLPAQFEEIIFRLGIPSQYLSASTAPQSTRAIEVIRYLEGCGRLHELQALLGPGNPGRRVDDAGDKRFPPLDRERPSKVSLSRVGSLENDAKAQIKILFLPSEPKNEERVFLAEECHDIDKRLQQGRYRESVELAQAWAITPRELSQTLLRHRPTIAHFTGHGSEEHGIVFQDEQSEGVAVAGELLGELFRILAPDGPRGVVLSHCYSALQVDHILPYVDFVVGISGQIKIESARAFSEGFYTGLVERKSIQQAFDLGCWEIKMSGGADSDSPRLRGRKRVNLKTLTLF